VTWILVAFALLAGGWLWTPDLERAELEARYANGPADFIEAAGMRLHVRDSGPREAPAVLLLHGFGSSLHTWEDWAQALSAERRVIRVDLPGAGLTGADPTGDYGDARSLQVLEALLDRLGVARASLVGHSMGGRLAWRFAAEHPDRVERLVLVAPDGFASPGFEYGKAPEVSALTRLMQVALPRVLVRMGLEPAFADRAAMTDARVDRYYDLLRAPGVRAALIARMEQVRLQDPVPLLARITAPVLLLWGDKDAMIPAANAADYMRALVHARGVVLVTLPGVGHLPQEERPAAALQPVREFLAGTSAPAAATATSPAASPTDSR
jgi:pimeloyl-ACP methyl ester carboxylesterase